jgi:hypothetical protein
MGLRGEILGMIVGLMIQFALGMLVNLFVTLPSDHPGANPSDFFSGSAQSLVWGITQGPIGLIGHIVLGTLLFVGSIYLAFRVWQLRRRPLRTLAVLGALMILAAGFNGTSFLDFNEEFSSMLMASFFALAVVFYAILLFLLPPRWGPAEE